MGAPAIAPGLLRPRDEAHLVRLGHAFEVTRDGQMVCIVLAGYRLPPGLTPERSDVLLRLPPGFPDHAPDMLWCAPAVTANGREIPATGVTETYLDRSWQRWSRHFASLWRPGIDDLASLLAILRRCFADAAGTTP